MRIATRASELALRQARAVQAALAARGVAGELVTYTTVGDRRLDEPLRAIGAKGLFTQELEADLLAGRVDCCVHSLKDLPTDAPPGLEVVALLPREDPRDALVVRDGLPARTLAELPAGARVGTSSLRRRAQLLALRPDLDVRELRGNVPTRLRKLDEGQVDAALLAAAGLRRLDLGQRIAAYLDAPDWLPAPGQGAIAVQARAADEALRPLLAALDDAATASAVAAERAFLAGLDGGCQVPIGALAVPAAGSVTGQETLVLHGLVASVDGRHAVRGSVPVDARAAATAGAQLARELRERGAEAILRDLHRLSPVPRPQPE
ncbi:MAG TPA: hydroxymethylbilane synthase [Gemmatimonadaceae bacterium]|nr:hydroxymethylbilane synthase [Gemmatimonadaceae bacterium]